MAIDTKKWIAFVEKHREKILAAERQIWNHPETGYREWKTTKYLEEEFEKLGYTLTKAGNIPGFITDIDTGRPGPKLLIFGEMDSLICLDHPEADKETGSVHACGHNAQCAALLGLAAALKEEGALDGLCGSIRLCAVPAEELLEQEFREDLVKKGIIRYYGGKVEFMYRGLFDGCDLAFMVHQTSQLNDELFMINAGSNGCFTKNVTYHGVSAHAGGNPQQGINALYAANLGLNASNSLRETFPDNDHIRFHPIITYGGTATNAIPDTVKLESYVRGASLEAIRRENQKINRALAASAAAMGANITISDRAGYMPYMQDQNMLDVAREAMVAICGSKDKIRDRGTFGTGCSDIGDICAVMPACHPYAGGAIGRGHGNDYYIQDADKACVNSAKMQLLMLVMLLSDGAARAKYCIANKKTPFASKEEYFAAVDSVNMDKKAVEYREDGSIVLNFTK
ncbi:MAG: amidohydrolase [Ruminococcaceae bacterium]|nr:amidohydrolase [Oscillospiraceae bacterium]